MAWNSGSTRSLRVVGSGTAPDPVKRIVWVVLAGAGHPKQTE